MHRAASKEGAKRPSKKRKLQQLKLQFKIPIGPVAKGAALLTDPAVEPPLDATNVVSRFVYVPPSVWPGLSEYGWVERGCDREAGTVSAAIADSLGVPLDAGGNGKRGSYEWSEQRVPAGASHEYVVAESHESIATLCRLLRERFEGAESRSEAPPRVVTISSVHLTAAPLVNETQRARELQALTEALFRAQGRCGLGECVWVGVT